MNRSVYQCASNLRIVTLATLLLLWLGLSTTAARATVVFYVDDNAQPGGDGLTWATAFQHPQPALQYASAVPGTPVEIRVAQGRYVPVDPTIGGDPRSVVFPLSGNVTLEGGYAGLSGGDPNSRDVKNFVTTLSGDISGNDQAGFINYEENAYHVVFCLQAGDTPTLDGFVISGGNANTDPDSLPDLHRHRGSGVLNVESSPTIRHCTFIANHATFGGAIYNRTDCHPLISDCRFVSNDADNGGVMYNYGSTPIVTGCEFTANTTGSANLLYRDSLEGLHSTCKIDHCTFRDNVAAGAAGVIDAHMATSSNIEYCVFVNNRAIGAGGAASLGTNNIVRGCIFKHNSSDYLGGGLHVEDSSLVIDCQFIQNHSGYIGGGASSDGADNTFVNCIFSRNDAVNVGGGMVAIHGATMVNCSVNNNTGGGITTATTNAALTVNNCVVWGNSPHQIAVVNVGPPPLPFVAGTTAVNHSDIQDGWTGPGSNNIDINPMFRQAGCDDLRLLFDSPCIDAGDNSALPPGTDTDLDGEARIQNDIVDMGAYEGGHDPQPPMACEDDLDQGEYAQMTPGLGTPTPAGHPSIFIGNHSGPDNASVTVSELAIDPHPGAIGGFDNLAATLRVETTLANGQFSMFTRVPFTEAQLNGADPLSLDLVYYESATNQWLLAAEGNTQNSPDHRGPLGDRFAQSGSVNPTISTDLGDYGVFWNTSTHKGFVWANLDHATDFAAGLPRNLCPADCDLPANGRVDLHDLSAVLDSWGQTQPAAGSHDVNHDGIVGINDLVAVIVAWGQCP